MTAFVRRPTGLIEQITGHSSYRVDLSGPITQGQSWQLGLAVIHLFHAEAQLIVFHCQTQLSGQLEGLPREGLYNPLGKSLKNGK